jgi:hypothetical protein
VKSFLVKPSGGTVGYWSQLPDGTFFEGEAPDGLKIGVSPSIGMVVIDIDVKNGKNGWNTIPKDIIFLLNQHFNYTTKSGGRHVWLKTKENLVNRATPEGVDLRVGGKGWCVWYSPVQPKDAEILITQAEPALEEWLKLKFG